MTEQTNRPRRTLPSAFDTPGVPMPSASQIATAVAAAAEFGITKAVKVPTIGEQKVSYSVRTTRDVRQKLNEYAYIERLTIGDAIDKLLAIAAKHVG